ncbi:MAG: maleylpyruvate isomerase N-terminal domain-containing protein, partial [Actinomycetota bacterium]|nr:maleylpyruvate isomerase N-terminal domain-containing protein [Actinomycetota bacterium]
MTDAVTAVAGHTARLLESAGRLPDASAPSLCEGWTRGHVLSHIARNAEAIGRLAEWAVSGTAQEMYPGGTTARNAEIELGAARPLETLVRDVADTAEALAPKLEALDGPLAVDAVEMRGGMWVTPA